MRLLEQISRCSSPQQRMALDPDEPLTLTKGVFSRPLQKTRSLLCQLTVGSQSQWPSARDQSLRGCPDVPAEAYIQYTLRRDSAAPDHHRRRRWSATTKEYRPPPLIYNTEEASRRTLSETPGGQSSGTPRL
ncbi:unnamed protein product [Arctogadus glacialis]